MLSSFELVALLLRADGGREVGTCWYCVRGRPDTGGFVPRAAMRRECKSIPAVAGHSGRESTFARDSDLIPSNSSCL